MSDSVPCLITAVGISAFVSLLAWRFGALTRSGGMAAWAVGSLILALGGVVWASALLTFFVTSTVLGRWSGQIIRRRIGVGPSVRKPEKGGRRDAFQVVANGGVPALCAMASGLRPSVELHVRHLSSTVTFPAHGLYIAFLAALATANGDTWATEVGAAAPGLPVLITSGKEVRPGTSGAVSYAGTLAAILGTALLSLFALGEGIGPFVIVCISGMAGVLADSFLGATLQAQWADPSSGELTERHQGSEKHVRGVAWMCNDQVNALSILLSAALALTLTVIF